MAALVAAVAPLFTFADPEVDESSGMAASSVTDDWFFTHNDSGDVARFFVVDRSGVTLATHTLPGVDAVDWEDMARGPDEQGRPSLWFGDIGDNDATRPAVTVYRVPEPDVDPSAPGSEIPTPPPARFELVYEDGPHDAETLLVHPTTGRLYVVTKSFFGLSVVYAAPHPLSAGAANRLERVAEVELQPTGSPGGPPQLGSIAQVAVTGGAVAPGGDRVVLRTYTDAHEWAVPGSDVAAALGAGPPPSVTPLPETEQGEAVTYSRDGTALLTTAEGSGAPVHVVPSALPEVTSPDTAAAVAGVGTAVLAVGASLGAALAAG